MSALILDIETVGEDWSAIDEQTKKVLAERITRLDPKLSDEDCAEQAEENLGFSPYTGQIVTVGVLDCDTQKGAVYYQAPGAKSVVKDVDGIKFAVTSEREMLEKFWELSSRYTEFVTFSGRVFDIPYFMIRSAILGVKPAKDLMRGRYLYQQSPGAIHIDLHDQMSFYGAITKLGGLHLACRAFGIETPKDGEIDGAKVGEYFKAGKYDQIAQYNARDLDSTRQLYLKWKQYLAF